MIQSNIRVQFGKNEILKTCIKQYNGLSPRQISVISEAENIITIETESAQQVFHLGMYYGRFKPPFNSSNFNIDWSFVKTDDFFINQ